MGKIIHIDGPDKTGKDSIRIDVVKKSKGTSLVYVRSFLSQIVYSRLYKRNIEEKWFFDEWKKAFTRGEKFYFIDCNFENIKNRFLQHNETDLDIKDWVEHRKVFYDVLQEADRQGIQVQKIDTTTDTIKQSSQKLYETL